jgi:hypothetical protein
MDLRANRNGLGGGGGRDDGGGGDGDGCAGGGGAAGGGGDAAEARQGRAPLAAMEEEEAAAAATVGIAPAAAAEVVAAEAACDYLLPRGVGGFETAAGPSAVIFFPGPERDRKAGRRPPSTPVPADRRPVPESPRQAAGGRCSMPVFARPGVLADGGPALRPGRLAALYLSSNAAVRAHSARVRPGSAKQA